MITLCKMMCLAQGYIILCQLPNKPSWQTALNAEAKCPSQNEYSVNVPETPDCSTLNDKPCEGWEQDPDGNWVWSKGNMRWYLGQTDLAVGFFRFLDTQIRNEMAQKFCKR